MVAVGDASCVLVRGGGGWQGDDLVQCGHGEESLSRDSLDPSPSSHHLVP